MFALLERTSHARLIPWLYDVLYVVLGLVSFSQYERTSEVSSYAPMYCGSIELLATCEVLVSAGSGGPRHYFSER
jgi:hypothetical protein